MSFEPGAVFTKNNLDACLKELAKELKKHSGAAEPAELILIGGAAILLNYGFRDMTADIDAVIRAASSVKEAVNNVGDRLGLPNGWLNTDFMRTASYSPALAEVSRYYKTFSNALEIRTVSAEYLIAMKLRSGRKYKNDLSDIIGILAEHEKRGSPISPESVDGAVRKLYGGWENMPADSKSFIEQAMNNGDYERVYADVNNEEQRARQMLLEFGEAYPGAVGEANVNDILKALKDRQKREAF